eukprot:TRINITY_DN10245_c0_g1_i1.p1 TRINITY_DN10245_c0_g1~~TRINITY_DN10245_c0_g1_i1.p1  ORF type:complete len:290 (-),score=53.21 TRINITY_DN10245_c0_g1_i1:48-866(-)
MIALVTGANQGIGYYIAHGLLHSVLAKPLTVFVAARSFEKGQEAVYKLNNELPLPNNNKAVFVKIDLDDDGTIVEAAKMIQSTCGGLDILVNNAAMAWKGDAWNEEVARTTFRTNYFGTMSVCNNFLPLIRPYGRVVNVSSFVGRLSIIPKPEIKQQFTKPNLNVEELNDLVNQFIQSVADNTYAQKGWPKSCYGMSKLALNAYTRILIRDEKREGVLIFAVCPGYCSTSMSSFRGTRPPTKGAETPIWLSLLPKDTNVAPGFYQDKVQQEW